MCAIRNAGKIPADIPMEHILRQRVFHGKLNICLQSLLNQHLIAKLTVNKY